MADSRQAFIETFEYIKQLVQMGQEPVYSLSEYRGVKILESELHGRPGVNHAPESEDGGPVWLEIKRLLKGKAPKPADMLVPWLNESHLPTRQPSLKEWILVTVSSEEVDEMVESGRAMQDNVLESLRQEHMYDVRLFARDDEELNNLFSNYLQEDWIPWANYEKPRRETIAIYEKLFAINQIMMAGELEQPIELVWGIGHAVWKVPESDNVINHPLLETLVEVELDNNAQSLRIRPRSVTQERPRIFTAPFEALQLSGVKPLKKCFEEHLDRLEAEERTLHPADPTSFDSILRSAVSMLSKDAHFVPDAAEDVTNRALPRAEESLAITDTWTIYARPRGSNYLVQDLERFQEKAKTDEKFDDSVATSFVKEPSAERPKDILWDLGQKSVSPTSGSLVGEIPEDRESDDTIYFPKPFNDRQRNIIERLDKADGVVVQGPPGTGKTHTIANIICHYLATGRRVLVTAKSQTALEVLEAQIPKEIQPLIISMVSNDREGMQQQKEAIETLQVKVVGLQGHERQIYKEIKLGEEEVSRLQKDVHKIDNQIEEFARRQLERLELDWAEKSFENLAELAEWIVENRASFTWFPDGLGQEEKYSPQFEDKDIEKLVRAKRTVGVEIKYLNVEVPSFSDLPDTETIERVHNDLVAAKRLESQAIGDSIPRFQELSIEVIGAAEALVQELRDVQRWIVKTDSAWLKGFFNFQVYPERPVHGWLQLVADIRPELAALKKERKRYLRKPVSHDAREPKEHIALKAAVERGSAGKNPSSILQRFDKRTRAIVKSVRVLGREPASTNDWEHVRDFLLFEEKCVELTARWNAIASEGPIPKVKPDRTGKSLQNIGEGLEYAGIVAGKLTEIVWNGLAKIFPDTSGFHKVEPKPECLDHVAKAIDQNLSLYRLSASEGARRAAIERLERQDCQESNQLRDLLTKKIGTEDFSITEITEEWRALMTRCKFLHGLSSTFEIIQRVLEKIKKSGATIWAAALSEMPITDEEENYLRNWREAWRWARLNTLLRSRDIQHELYSLEERRQEKEDRIKKVFEDVVKKRTFLMLCQTMTDRAKSGLAKFTAAMMKVGRGTGITAPTFMRAAQKAMLQCAEAIPCWIMPSWRVSEVLPAEFDFFDLVIVDEASQCDIRELPAIARGKKLLIVGDDRQVSPLRPGIEHKKTLQLRYNYLADKPFGDLMWPTSSLYELAGAVFPGNKIILNEHFRCVEPIIRFSFQFYSGVTIHPLRIPKATERIDPPLVDVYVEDGLKKGELNYQEAEVIVDEIEKITQNSIYDRRSIGVISLIGRKQAALISKQLLERIGQEEYLKHKIICGDSATFQGREKDIVFLSMVATPGQSRALTMNLNAQRFNVATSRARDRLYVIRSVELDELKPNDLKAKLIRHLQEPMPLRRDIDQELVELCESRFELQVFTELTNKGYLTTPQVPVGAYRIDLVVEGDNDRRLAIELDGDMYHGPEKWLADWTRQKVLERAGWKFWRCWASNYINDPVGCLDSLIQKFEHMGIKPVKNKAKIFPYTDFRRVNTELGKIEGAVIASQEESEVVAVEDKVSLDLEDSSEKSVTVLISEERCEPDNLIFDKEHPVAGALIGRAIGDEVYIDILGKNQNACIAQLAKGKAQESFPSETQDLAAFQRPQGDEAINPRKPLSAKPTLGHNPGAGFSKEVEGEVPEAPVGHELELESEPSGDPIFKSSTDAQGRLQDAFDFCAKKTEQRERKSSGADILKPGSLFAPYNTYDGPVCDDPRTTNAANVAEGLCRIIETEGPMLAKRAYDTYLRSCGIRRMGRDLKSLMNRALQSAIRKGRIISEDEWKEGGIIKAIVRTDGSPPIKLRQRGPRTFEELPPSEVLVTASLAMEGKTFQKGSDEHLHAILEMFNLKRLTTPTGTRLLETLEMSFDYSKKWLDENTAPDIEV